MVAPTKISMLPQGEGYSTPTQKSSFSLFGCYLSDFDLFYDYEYDCEYEYDYDYDYDYEYEYEYDYDYEA